MILLVEKENETMGLLFDVERNSFRARIHREKLLFNHQTMRLFHCQFAFEG
jgi:hypothetical protein